MEPLLLMEFGWSWQEYLDTPEDVLEKLLILRAAKGEVANAKSEQG